MSHSVGLLSATDFLDVVRNAPLVAIDLVVQDGDGRILLGLRTNSPARGWWFVPGGRIRKAETLVQAFRRITQTELGKGHELAVARLLGAYEHLYDEDFTGGSDVGTHYVVLAYHLELDSKLDALPLEQHEGYRWVRPVDARDEPTIHPNSRAYVDDLIVDGRRVLIRPNPPLSRA